MRDPGISSSPPAPLPEGSSRVGEGEGWEQGRDTEGVVDSSTTLKAVPL